MTTLYIEDLKLGLDTRRSRTTAEPGSLRVLDNLVITNGGEAQKRKAFVKVLTLPAGTKGLVGTNLGPTAAGAILAGALALQSFPAGASELFVFGLAPEASPSVLVDSRFLTSGPPSGGGLIANLTAATGEIVPVTLAALTENSSFPTLVRVLSVIEYGAQQFFVVGVCEKIDGTLGLFNWWAGALVFSLAGYAPFVAGQKTYRLLGSVIYFSGVGDPADTYPLNGAGTGPNTMHPGAGFIDTGTLAPESQWLVGGQTYFKQTAVFSRKACLLFQFDPDPSVNALQQVLKIGAVSAGSILQFGTGEVLFLSDTGIRSLRVLNASLAAGVIDVGSPIDTIIQAALAADASGGSLSPAIIEPATGRYWIAIGNTIYILSYWPSAKINAWNTFTLPFNVDAMCVSGSRIFIRSGDDIYCYGGLDGTAYDNCVGTLVTPHHHAGTPSAVKDIENINVAATGNWSISLGTSTNNLDFFELAANLAGDTYSIQEVPFAGECTHIAFKATTSDAGPSVLGAISVQFRKGLEQ